MEKIPGQKEHYLMSAKDAEEMFPEAFQHSSQSTFELEASSQDAVNATNATFSGNK